MTNPRPSEKQHTQWVTTGTRQRRECTVCGEIVPASHATPLWEAHHAHGIQVTTS